MSPEKKKETKPAQRQKQQPGRESEMRPRPGIKKKAYRGSGKLDGRTALITGGDSGIGRAVAVYFARKGADVAVVYLNEHEDARETKSLVEKEGRRCILFAGDVGKPEFCEECFRKTVDAYGKIDILVNNAGEQHEREILEEIAPEQLERTFRTNIFSFFFMAGSSLRHMKTGERHHQHRLCDGLQRQKNPDRLFFGQGAIVAFTRSLALNPAEKGIRVNAVAPGPIWTPLIPATFTPEHVKQFGADTPRNGRANPRRRRPATSFSRATTPPILRDRCCIPMAAKS